MLVVLHRWFNNFPEELLTIALSVAAALLLWIAFFGEKIHKAVACAYVLLP